MSHAQVRILLVSGAALLLLVFVAGTAVAQTGYAIGWWTIDGGGGTASLGQLVLNGTIGQADAALGNAGANVLWGGYWGPSAPAKGVYLPLLVK